MNERTLLDQLHGIIHVKVRRVHCASENKGLTNQRDSKFLKCIQNTDDRKQLIFALSAVRAKFNSSLSSQFRMHFRFELNVLLRHISKKLPDTSVKCTNIQICGWK